MSEVAKLPEAGGFQRNRKSPHKKGGHKGKKKGKVYQGSGEKAKKIDGRMRRLYQKRARDYNSDDEDGEDRNNKNKKKPYVNSRQQKPKFVKEHKKPSEPDNLTEEPLSDDEDEDGDADAEAEALPGIMKFAEGVRAFKTAFKSIIKKSVPEDSLGPILSGQMKLVAEKLAEEDAERKQKGESKKEKHKIAEQGHVKPANYLDVHDKFLIGVATKGVVKLFNAVNKAQHAQKGLNPSSFKDEKAIKKRRREAFFGELGKRSKANNASSDGGAANEGPSWAPLRDNFMLTNPKLKDWDKMKEKTGDDDEDDMANISEDSSSDDE